MVEYLRGSKLGQLVRKELDSGNELLTNAISLAELTSKLRRERLDVDAVWRVVTALSKTIPVKEADVKEAGILHATIKETKPKLQPS